MKRAKIGLKILNWGLISLKNIARIGFLSLFYKDNLQDDQKLCCKIKVSGEVTIFMGFLSISDVLLFGT
jgi:hypothetical protein